jgi:hypothetical protein
MDGMDQALIPFVVLAPPGPVHPHVAQAHPTEADFEVRSPYPPFRSSSTLQTGEATPLGRKDF